MKLLHPYVDVVPGRPGMRPSTPIISEGQIVAGSAVVRVINTTDQENAYTLRLKCEEPYWQEEWYTIISLPPDPTRGENAPPTGKPDVRGPQDRWVRVFVPRGGTRDILIRFNVPQRAEARARRYQYAIEIETQIITPAAGARRRDRVTTLTGTATVQPFYKWTLDVTPEDHHVGLLRRTGHYEVIITNESNDWLYCDLKAGRRKELVLETPTVRAAIPPPEPGETITLTSDTEPRVGVQRTIPLKAVSKIRVVRGNLTPLPIPITAVRVDAPSVAPVFDEGSHPESRPVTADVTSETHALPQDRNLTYCPPIASNVTDFFSRSGSWIRGLVMTVLGAVIAVPVMLMVYENVFHNNVLVEPMALNTTAGASMKVRGQWLPGAVLSVGEEKDGFTEVSPKFTNMADLSVCTIVVPVSYDHKLIKVRAQRFVRWFPFLTPLLPSFTSLSTVQVGSLDTPVVVKPAQITNLASGQRKPGQPFAVYGTDMGTGGIVLLNNAGYNAVSWTPTKVVADVPSDASPGQLIVQLLPTGTTAAMPAGAIDVLPVPLPPGTVPAVPGAPGIPGSPGAAPGSPAGSPVPAAPQALPVAVTPPPPVAQPARPVAPPVRTVIVYRPAPNPVRPTPGFSHPTRPVQQRPQPQPQQQPVSIPVPIQLAQPGNSGGMTAKQRMLQQINGAQATVNAEQARMNQLTSQRNTLYSQVQSEQPNVDLSNQSAVNAFNSLVSQANAANNAASAAIAKYHQDVATLNELINRYNTIN